MSYLKANETHVYSSRWRRDHQALLSECGVPTEVSGNDRRWGYVLDHGDDELGTGWTPNWITVGQAKKLLSTLEKDWHDSPFFDLRWYLRKRIERGES